MRRHNYLVGYSGDGNCAYGNPKEDYRFTNLMTLHQATRLSKKIFTRDNQKKIKSNIYKLVVVKKG